MSTDDAVINLEVCRNRRGRDRATETGRWRGGGGGGGGGKLSRPLNCLLNLEAVDWDERAVSTTGSHESQRFAVLSLTLEKIREVEEGEGGEGIYLGESTVG